MEQHVPEQPSKELSAQKAQELPQPQEKTSSEPTHTKKRDISNGYYVAAGILGLVFGGVIASVPSYSSGIRHTVPTHVYERQVANRRVIVTEDGNRQRNIYVEDTVGTFKPLEEIVKDKATKKTISNDAYSIPYHR